MPSKFHKRPPRPDRVREVPRQFSWIDHRLVREHWMEGRSPEALALYLFLVTVADREGLSYYSDRSAAGLLGLNEVRLVEARGELIKVGMIAYEKPVYQVLPLDGKTVPSTGAFPRSGQVQSMAQVLQQMGLTGGKP